MSGTHCNTELAFKVHYKIDTIEHDWELLGSRLSQYYFYHKPAWYKAYANSFAATKKLFFIGIYQQHELCGVIPLEYVILKKCALSIKVLRLPYHPHLDLSDCLISEDLNPSIATGQILQSLLSFINQQQSWPWDVIFFGKTPENSHAQKLFSGNPVKHYYRIAHGYSSFIQCDNTYAQSVAHISSKFRRNISRLERKAEKQGKLSYNTFHYSSVNDYERLKQHFQTFLNVESDSWKATTQTAIIYDPQAVQFYRCLCENYHYPDTCVINDLQLNDEVIAVQFGIRVGKRLNLLKIGFREKHKGIGPGNIILNYTLKDAVNNGLNLVSTTTAPAWAEKWKSGSTSLYRHLIFKQNLAGQTARMFFLLLPLLKKIKSRWLKFQAHYFKKSNIKGKH